MKRAISNKSTLMQSDITRLINTMKVIFPTVDEIRKIVQEEIKFLPTKEEFFSRMDKLSGEIKATREEQVLHAEQHGKINDRLDKHDKHLGISTAS